MSEDLQERVNAVEEQLEKSLGQLSTLVDFMGKLSAALGQLTNSWIEQRAVASDALEGHKQSIAQLLKAQTQIAGAVDNLSRQCVTMFKLQNERLAALEAAEHKAEIQRPN